MTPLSEIMVGRIGQEQCYTSVVLDPLRRLIFVKKVYELQM